MTNSSTCHAALPLSTPAGPERLPLRHVLRHGVRKPCLSRARPRSSPCDRSRDPGIAACCHPVARGTTMTLTVTLNDLVDRRLRFAQSEARSSPPSCTCSEAVKCSPGAVGPSRASCGSPFTSRRFTDVASARERSWSTSFRSLCDEAALLLRRGKPVELWEDSRQPFGWAAADLDGYARATESGTCCSTRSSCPSTLELRPTELKRPSMPLADAPRG